MLPVSMYYQNVRGLRTKASILYRNVCVNSYDIICFTESWLNDGFFNNELFDDRYVVWRRDRNYAVTEQKKGGGVLIAVNREIAAENRTEWSSSAEDLWLTLTIRNRNPSSTYKVHICVVYICDDNLGNSLHSQLSNFADNLSKIVLDNPFDKVIVLGDFNMPLVSWSPSGDASSLIPGNLQGAHQIDLIDSLNTCNLLQYNSILNKSHGRLLDLIFSNNDVAVRACDYPLVPEDPHHPCLSISAEFVQLHTIKPLSYTKFNYHDGDYHSICTELDAVDWYSELGCGTVDDAVSFIYKTIYSLRDTYITSKTVVPSRKYPLWYKRPLIKLLKEKAKFHKKFKTYGNLSDQNSFIILRDRARLMESEMYNDYIKNIENSIRMNPRAFWSYAKSKNQSNAYPSVMQYGTRSM